MLLLPIALLAQACVGSVGPTEENELAQSGAREAPQAPEDPAAGQDEAASPKGDVELPPAIDAWVPAEAKKDCADISDEDVLAAVYGGPKVPPGFYVDEPEKDAWAMWGSGCAPDMASVTKDAAIEAESSAGALVGSSRTTPYFYEVDIALDVGYTIHYRKTRCDYFDGAKLAGEASEDAIGELAMYHWYSTWAFTGGYHALGGVSRGDDGAYSFTLCEARVSYGDCGLCDDVALVRSTYTLAADGAVKLPGAPVLVRLFKGHCDG